MKDIAIVATVIVGFTALNVWVFRSEATWRREEQFTLWLERRFGEGAPQVLAWILFAISAGLGTYFLVTDLRRIWGV